jgi:hypothetical protein
MIDVTGIDKVAFAKAVYRLSVPQGLGIHQARMGELDDSTAQSIADAQPFYMDYVNGRACKMHLSQRDGKLMAPESWYDHTDDQYERLLSEFKISRETVAEHGTACNCSECMPKPTNRHPEWEKHNAAPNN